MKSSIIVAWAEKLSNKEIEDRLFWAVFDAEKVFGKERVEKEMDFEFDRVTQELTFSSDGEINKFVSNVVLGREPDGTEKGERAGDFRN